jgi:hypothetical protein
VVADDAAHRTVPVQLEHETLAALHVEGTVGAQHAYH